MMNKSSLLCVLISSVFLLPGIDAQAQDSETVWFDGNARSLFERDALGESNEPDTLSARNTSNGYNLLDLNVHINPIEDFEVFAQLRVRNTFGSFFGSGTDVSVRQLRASGVINEKVRFNIGDLFLKQSPFTLWNADEDLSNIQGAFSSYQDIIHYENFYVDNRWRLQGLQTDFSFAFDRYLRTIEIDLFATRPRGSTSLGNSQYLSDRLLCGGSLLSQFTRTIGLELNYVNLFDAPASGTADFSVRNSVYHSAVVRKSQGNNLNSEQRIESGFSNRYWLSSAAESENQPRQYETRGMFFSLSNSLQSKDSLFTLNMGLRYVDPNFRSAGAQTRRVNFDSNASNAVYPVYSNEERRRDPAAFDVLTDVTRYNQDISSVLMGFNPMYSNVLPYGEATPNRQGVFARLLHSGIERVFVSRLNVNLFQEVVGQGTAERRKFGHVSGRFRLNLEEKTQWNRKLSITWSADYERSNREGLELEALDLKVLKSNVALEAEVLRGLFLQCALSHVKSSGREFMIKRSDFGEINGYEIADYNQMDRLISTGFCFKWTDRIYANLQYNWWGVKYGSGSSNDYQFNRLFFVLAIEL